MGKLLYRADFDEARNRLSSWWDGNDIGRPAMQITAPRQTPLEDVPQMAAPAGWVTDYSTTDFEYRVYLSRKACVNTNYMAEAIPVVSPNLAPNCLALYLGCRGIDQPDTVWCEPCIESPETAIFLNNPDNFYWNFTQRLTGEQLRLGANKFMVQFPDLIEGLDTLAAMRGTEHLLIDLIDRPEWVQTSLSMITEKYFEYYNILYEMIQDERGGSCYWAWAPGRIAKLQCDFSAMISPDMFADFMVPVLNTMTDLLDYSIYHWDGPGAIPHHECILSVPGINMIQWTSGAGIEPVWDRRWWPLYHKTIDAGKKMMLLGFQGEEGLYYLEQLKKEFREKLSHFMISLKADTVKQGEKAISLVSL